MLRAIELLQDVVPPGVINVVTGYGHEAGVTPNMRIYQEEIFGPVLSVIRYSDVEEAIAMANDSCYGCRRASGVAIRLPRSLWLVGQQN